MVVIYLMSPSTFVQQPTAVAALRLGEGEWVQEMGGLKVSRIDCVSTNPAGGERRRPFRPKKKVNGDR